MAQVSVSLADNLTVSVPSGLTAGVEHLLWSSAEVSAGAQHNSCAVRCQYQAFTPDPSLSVNQPFDHALLFVLEEKQDDNSWVEVGRQNDGIRLLEQGPRRTLIVSPSVTAEEGVDFVIPTFGGTPFNLKSEFRDDTEGNNLRVCLVLLENQPDTPNALDSVTFSLHLKRFDS